MRLRKKIKKRNKLWQEYNCNPSYLKLLKYKKVRNDITASIRKAKEEFEWKLAEKIKTDTKSFYSYVKSKSKTKPCIGPLKNSMGKTVDDEVEMGEILNKHFSSVFTVEDLTNLPVASSVSLGGKNCLISDIDITEDKIRAAIKKMGFNKSAGIDEFNSTLIKECEDSVVQPLFSIFKSSLESSEIPDDWKRANVVALFKKGGKHDQNNYKPVSLTCHICKLLEHILKEELINYLELNKILYDSQHGVRKGRSCLTNLLELMEEVASSVDNGEPVDIIFLDFQKSVWIKCHMIV